MRIKEAIQRRKLIQQLNDEYLASQIDLDPHHYGGNQAKMSFSTATWGDTPAEDGGNLAGEFVPVPGADGELASKRGTIGTDILGSAHETYISLAQFVGEFNGKLSDGHVSVWWKRRPAIIILQLNILGMVVVP